MAPQQPAHMLILSYALESWEGAFGNDSVVVYDLNYGKTTIYVNIVGLSGYEVEKLSMRNKGTTDFTHIDLAYLRAFFLQTDKQNSPDFLECFSSKNVS